jgi:hypothetical protein
MPTTGATDVAVKFLDQTKLLPRAEKASADGSEYTCEYVYADGDPTFETTVFARVTTDVKNNRVSHTLRLRTVQTVTTDSVIMEQEPLDVTLFWTTPGRMEDSGKVLDMIGTAYSLAFNGVTSKVPNSGIIDALNRSLVGNLYG